MTTLLPALLATLLLSTSAFAQERGSKGGDPADDLTCRAFYAEVARRDFAAAEELYSSAIAQLEKGGSVDALVKVRVGRARCLAALGRKDDARAELGRALQAKPGDADATAELARLAAPEKVSERIANRIRGLLDELGNEQTRAAAEADLARIGNVAVPMLAGLLLDEDVTRVSRSARALALIGTREAFEALAAALADPRLLYPGAVAEAFQGLHVSRTNLPAYLAALRLGRIELRESVAESLSNGALLNAQDASAAELIEVMAADASPSVREAAFRTSLPSEVAEAIVPLLRRMLDSPDAAERWRAAAFLTRSPAGFPSQLHEELLTRIKKDTDPKVRSGALLFDLQRYRKTDPARTVAPLLELLSDRDPLVFGKGVDWLNDTQVTQAIDSSAHEVLARVLARALEDDSLSVETREQVVNYGPYRHLEDEELVELFLLGARAPAGTSQRLVERFRSGAANTLRQRHSDPAANDAFATSILGRIPDAAGRKLWLQYVMGGPQLLVAAANDADPGVRDLALLRLQADTVDSNDLRFLAEDLPRLDEKTLIQVLQALLERPDPRLVAPLRAIHAKAKGALALLSLRALGFAGGAEALPDLLEAMRSTPKDDNFNCFDLVAKQMGTAVVPELVAIARRNGDSRTVMGWVTSIRGDASLNSQIAEAYLQQAPSELVRINDVRVVADWIPAEMLRKRVLTALRGGDRSQQHAAASMAGTYQIEAAWDDLIRLLDAGDGNVRQAALGSLQKLREYRELRGFATNADADARRAAFEKAKALLASADPEQRGAAALALGALGEVAAVPLLLDLVGDANADVRAAARKALEKLSVVPAPAPVPGPASKPAKSEK